MSTSSLDPTSLEPVIIKQAYTPRQAHRQYALLNATGTLLSITRALPASPLDGDIVVLLGVANFATTTCL